MKLEKDIVERRVRLMKEEGVLFKTGVNVGKDVTAAELQKQFDRVILACGASNPRDIEVPGRDSKNIYFAVDFLSSVTKSLLDQDLKEGTFIPAKGKHVLVIGGGDTGNDCVGSISAVRAEPTTFIELINATLIPPYPRIAVRSSDSSPEIALMTYWS